MKRDLEVNNRLYKQTSDKQMTTIYLFYTVYIVANGTYNNTRLRVPSNLKVQANCI